MFRQLICGFLCASVALGGMACTNNAAMVRPNAGQVVNNVGVGDFVRIHARNGQTYSVEVIEVASTYLRGQDLNTGKRYRIPLSQINVMEYEKVDPVASTALGVVILYVVAVAVAIYALAGSDFGDSWNGGGC